MALQDDDIQKILSFVKQEPRTIQEVSKHIGRSWVTADSYVKQVSERTGLVHVKTFRKGTQGALKLVHYNYAENMHTDDVRSSLLHQIKSGRFKNHFDFMEIYQHVPADKKKSVKETIDMKSPLRLTPFLEEATRQLFCFSGNLSFINAKEHDRTILEVLEDLLKRNVRIKIICRVNIASIDNITKLAHVALKYPNLLELRHSYQPLRGFIIDDTVARFKDEFNMQDYKEGELSTNTRILYHIYDENWIMWLQKVFWHLFRSSLDYPARVKELQNIF